MFIETIIAFPHDTVFKPDRLITYARLAIISATMSASKPCQRVSIPKRWILLGSSFTWMLKCPSRFVFTPIFYVLKRPWPAIASVPGSKTMKATVRQSLETPPTRTQLAWKAAILSDLSSGIESGAWKCLQ